MKAEQRFLRQPKHLWANVRTISQKLGYTERGRSAIKVPTLAAMREALLALGLESSHLLNADGRPLALGEKLHDYFRFRADVLNNTVEPLLMTVKQAASLFAEHKRLLAPSCPLPMNKQKGKKKAPAYFTGLINLLIEANAKGYPCDYDPGSRQQEKVDVKHYLMVDAHYTWWDCGKSYLCRIVDMLHMGYVDEVLFGREVVTEKPRIVKEWVAMAKAAGRSK